jgi:hypothetical protein
MRQHESHQVHVQHLQPAKTLHTGESAALTCLAAAGMTLREVSGA